MALPPDASALPLPARAGPLQRAHQGAQLLFAQHTHLARAHAAQPDVHDAHALEPRHLKAQVFAHAADLAVEALHQDDVEGMRAGFAQGGGQGDLPQDGHAGGHALQELGRDLLVDRDLVFLLMPALGAQDAVDDVPVGGHEDQAFGVLVQPAHRVDAGGVAEEVDDVVFLARVGGGDDAHRLVGGQVDLVALGLNELTAHHDPRVRGHALAQGGHAPVDGDLPGCDQPVGLPP